MQVEIEIEATLARLVDEAVEEKLAAALAANDPWLTSDAAAQYLGLSRATIHDLVNDGLLPRHGMKGHRLRFRRTELDTYASRGH